MNTSTFNGVAINGSAVGTTIRVIVSSVASAFMTVTVRVWKRSAESVQATAIATDGRVWRRSPEQVTAQASPSVVATVLALVRSTVNAIGQAVTVVTATGKPPTFVRSAVSVLAFAATSGAATIWRRAAFVGEAVASAVFIGRRRTRSPESMTASASAVVSSSVYQQLPFDKAAPADRAFRVPPANNVFYVRK